MSSLLITNAKIVNENSVKEADILIKNGRIEQIDSELTHRATDKTLDAAGKIVMPGMIDDQVHFREPGLTHKGDMATESRAALAGGITSFMEMPNCNPLTITHETLEAKCRLAAQKSAANFAFYLGASNDNIEQIKSLDPKAACGVKVFMGASTGNMLVDDPYTLEQIFIHSPVLIATHCEDTPTIIANEARFKAKYGDDIPVQLHPLIRSEEACYQSSSLAVSLARQHGSRLHVLHLTTAKELELFEAGNLDNKRITVEACVHHLFFNSDDYAGKGNLIKCNPAIKTKADQISLQNAVKSGVIDVIATDHAPHTWEEKQQPYIKAPAGLPLVQHALLSLLELYHKDIFDLELIVHKTSHAPATLFNVVDRGFIREGYWADLVVVDLNKPMAVTKDTVLYKCGWSPFEGHTFRSSIETTILNGKIAYHEG
ncbi:MAG TPA: dihydroorotase, partial [Gammaproteobacteria bacterium]